MKTILLFLLFLSQWSFSTAQIIDTTLKSSFLTLGVIHNEFDEKELIVTYNQFISPEHFGIKQDYYKARTLVLKENGLIPKWDKGFFFINELRSNNRFIRANTVYNWDINYFSEPTDPWLYAYIDNQIVHFYFSYEWVVRHALSTEIIDYGDSSFSDGEAIFLNDKKNNRLLVSLNHTASFEFSKIDSVIAHGNPYEAFFFQERVVREVASYFSDTTVVPHNILAILPTQDRKYLAHSKGQAIVLDSVFNEVSNLGSINSYNRVVRFSKDSSAIAIGASSIFIPQSNDIITLPFSNVRKIVFSDTSASTIYFHLGNHMQKKSVLYKSLDLGRTYFLFDSTNVLINDIEVFQGDVYAVSDHQLVRYRNHEQQKDTLGMILSTQLEEVSPEKLSFELHQAYPNPFNPSTTISFTLDQRTDVQIELFSVLGQKIATILKENRSAGHHSIYWDASNFSSGVYFIRLISNTSPSVFVQKVTLLK